MAALEEAQKLLLPPPPILEPSVSFEGRVVDGYISGALLCLDINGDYQCQENEPQTKTDSEGKYSLSVKKSLVPEAGERLRILSIGGYDVTAKKSIEAPMSVALEVGDSKLSYEAELTPITSITDLLNEENNEELSDTKQEVAEFFEVEKEEVDEDPVEKFEEEQKPDLFYQAIKIIKLVDLLFAKTGLAKTQANYKLVYASIIAQLSQGVTFDDISSIDINGTSYDIAEEFDVIDSKIKEITTPPEEGDSRVSQSGEELAGSETNYKNSDSKEQKALEALSAEVIKAANDSLEMVTTDLFLPKKGKYRTKFSWDISDTTYLSEKGKVTRPEYGVGDVNIIITATTKKGKGSGYSQSFEVTIKAKELADDSKIIELDSSWLTFDIIKAANASKKQISSPLELVRQGKYGSVIRWSSDTPISISATGLVTRQAEATDVVLTATIESNSEKQGKIFYLQVIPSSTTDEFLLEQAVGALDVDDMLFFNANAGAITTPLWLISNWIYGTSIAWTSSNEAVISSSGQVNRPTADTEVTLTASISLNGLSKTKSFQLTVKGDSGADTVQADYELLTFESFRLANLAESAIASNLNLYTKGHEGSEIVWTSSNENYITTSGSVVRPTSEVGDVVVVLTATISSNSSEKQKQFSLKVLSEMSAQESALDQDFDMLVFDLFKGDNLAANTILHNLKLPTQGIYGSKIEWDSSNFSVITHRGYVRRPDTDTEVSLTAVVFSADETSQKEKTFSLVVKGKEALDTIAQYAQSVLNKEGKSAEYKLRYLGQLYTIKLKSNLVLNDSDLYGQSEPLKIHLDMEGKSYPQAIQLAQNYFNKNIKIEFYKASDTSKLLYTSDALLLNKKNFQASIEEFGYVHKAALLPPAPDDDPDKDYGLEKPPRILQF